MKLGKIYDNAVKFGREADPRPKEKVEEALRQSRKVYNKLKGEAKAMFDKEKLKNPYADSRILYGERDREVNTIMVGIDIGGEELLLCDQMNRSGRGIDLAMSHHPHGPALARLSQVMGIHTDMLNKLGISLDIARGLMDERIKETDRAFTSRNYARYISTAKLLDIPYMCCHTVADNHVAGFLQRSLDRAKPRRLKDVLVFLNKIPEYKESIKADAGPKIVIGKDVDSAGKVFVDMTGGTEGSKRVFARLSQAGVKTLVGMHFSEEHIKIAKREYINLIIGNHMASDTIGVNLLLDKLCKIEKFDFISVSGFMRVERG